MMRVSGNGLPKVAPKGEFVRATPGQVINGWLAHEEEDHHHHQQRAEWEARRKIGAKLAA